MKEHFDVAVIGAQLGGLVAAGLLAKRGHRVALIPSGEGLQYYHHNGWRLPLCPVLWPDLRSCRHIRQIYRELGESPFGIERRQQGTTGQTQVTEDAAKGWQIIFPGKRFGGSVDCQSLIDLLAVEFSDQQPAINELGQSLKNLRERQNNFLASAPTPLSRRLRYRFAQRRFLQRVRDLRDHFDDHEVFGAIPADHPLRAAIVEPLRFLSFTADDQPTTFQVARLLCLLSDSVPDVESRMASVHQHLLEVCSSGGATIKQSDKIDAVNLGHFTLKDLALQSSSGERQQLTAKWYIDATERGLSEWMPKRAIRAKYTLGESAVQQVAGMIVVNLVLRRDAIVPGLRAAAFILGGREAGRNPDEDGDMPILLRRYQALKRQKGDKEGGVKLDPNHVLLSLATPARLGEAARSPGRLEELTNALLARFRRVMPFYERHLVLESRSARPGSWDLDSDASNRRVDPWQSHPLYELGKQSSLGVIGRPVETAYRNLYRVSREIAPGLGVEGELLAGAAAADIIHERHSKARR